MRLSGNQVQKRYRPPASGRRVYRSADTSNPNTTPTSVVARRFIAWVS